MTDDLKEDHPVFTRILDSIDDLDTKMTRWMVGYMEGNEFRPGMVNRMDDLARRVAALESKNTWVVQIVAHVLTATVTAVISGWAVMTILGGKIR